VIEIITKHVNHLLYKRETILNFIWYCYLLSGCPADIKA